MSRKDEFKSNQNPATRFLEWKSDNKAFEYYDKEKQQKLHVQIPFKFLVLKRMHTVKGWSNSSESGIFANEVQYIGNEPLNVRSFKGGEISKGLWKDISNRVKDFGGYYVRSVYIMTEEGEIWNIAFKGSAASAWYNFEKNGHQRMFDEWVEVIGCREDQNGAVKYFVPQFAFASSLSDEQNEKAEQVYSTLMVYMNAYKVAQGIVNEAQEDKAYITQDLPPAAPLETYQEQIEDDMPF